MKRNVLTCTVLVLTVYLAILLPTAAFAYTPFSGYSGTPIKYGGWILGEVTMEMRHIIRKIPWVKITVTGTDVDGKSVTKEVHTNGFGSYRVYLPPGNYTVTASHAQYSQTYNVPIREDQIYRFLNIYLERSDAPEFQDYLQH
jgi:CubicO group peptidase (beta-lactamase class C family)